MNWFYVDESGQRGGPVDEAGLDALIAARQINSTTLVWHEGMSDWQPLGDRAPAPAMAAPVINPGEAVCVECGGVFPVEETIRVGKVQVCANCKPVFVQKMREGVAPTAPMGSLVYAGFWLRFGAVFLDGILLLIINTALNLAFGLGIAGVSGTAHGEAAGGFLGVALMLIELALGAVYEIFMVGKYGATLGKMACKIRVVTPTGAPISFGRALGRYFAKILSQIICLIGFIIAAFDDEKRALHDRICDTRVILG